MVEKKYKDKAALVGELHEKIGRASAVVVTEYRGLKAGDLVKLRRGLRDANVEVLIVKNTLLRRAAEGTPVAPLAENLTGPTAVAIAYGEATDAAKKLTEGAKDFEPFVLKSGIVEAMVLDENGLTALSKVPGRAELQSQVAGAFEGFIGEFAGLIESMVREFAGLLEAKVEADGAAA